ncbi:hypothetical protein Tco_0957535, partial [Tanacetum coccineum]
MAKFLFAKRSTLRRILKNFDMSECKRKDTPLVVNEKPMKEDGSSKVDATPPNTSHQQGPTS